LEKNAFKVILPSRVLLAAFTIESISKVVMSPSQMPIFEFSDMFAVAISFFFTSVRESLLIFSDFFFVALKNEIYLKLLLKFKENVFF
jgi:hypothetical protein